MTCPRLQNFPPGASCSIKKALLSLGALLKKGVQTNIDFRGELERPWWFISAKETDYFGAINRLKSRLLDVILVRSNLSSEEVSFQMIINALIDLKKLGFFLFVFQILIISLIKPCTAYSHL